MGQAMPLHKKLEPSAMLLPSSLPHRYIEAGVAESVLLLNGQACTYPQGFLSAGEQLAAGLGCSYLGLPFGVGVSGTSCLDSLGLCYPPSVLGHSTPLATSPLSPGCLLAGGGFLHDGLFCGYPEEALHWAYLSKRQGANLESIALSAEDDDSATAKEHNNRRHSAHPPSAVSPLSPKNGGSLEDSKESNVSSYIKCWGEGLRSSCPWVSKAEWPQDNKQAPSESVYSSCLNRSFPEAALEVAMRQVSKEGVDKGVLQQASKDSVSEKVVDLVKKECPKGRTALSRYTKLGRSYPGSALSKALREARSDTVNKPLHWSKDNALPTSKDHGKEIFSKKVDGVITQSLQHQDNQILGNSKLAEDKEEDYGDRHKMCTKIVCDDVLESATSPADFPFAPSEDIPRQNHPEVQTDALRESHRSKRLCQSLGTEAKMGLSQSCLDGSLSEALQKAGEPRGGGNGSVSRKRTTGTSKASSRARGSGRISTGLSRSYPGSTLSKALRRACSAASGHGGSTSCLLASTNSDGGTGASESDEELTNLDWLYEGTNPLHSLSLGHEQGELLRSLSPARDAASTDSSSQIMASPNTARGSATVTGKPPYSFSCLIFLAIEFSPGKRLPVRDIYSWILENFPYFASAPTGWKNSVRHNLSLNKCFRRVEKDRSQAIGKGSLWCIDPEYRPSLLQALSKTPYQWYSRVFHTPPASPQSCHSSSAEHQSSTNEEVTNGYSCQDPDAAAAEAMMLLNSFEQDARTYKQEQESSVPSGNDLSASPGCPSAFEPVGEKDDAENTTRSETPERPPCKQASLDKRCFSETLTNANQMAQANFTKDPVEHVGKNVTQRCDTESPTTEGPLDLRTGRGSNAIVGTSAPPVPPKRRRPSASLPIKKRRPAMVDSIGDGDEQSLRDAAGSLLHLARTRGSSGRCAGKGSPSTLIETGSDAS